MLKKKSKLFADKTKKPIYFLNASSTFNDALELSNTKEKHMHTLKDEKVSLRRKPILFDLSLPQDSLNESSSSISLNQTLDETVNDDDNKTPSPTLESQYEKFPNQVCADIFDRQIAQRVSIENLIEAKRKVPQLKKIEDAPNIIRVKSIPDPKIVGFEKLYSVTPLMLTEVKKINVKSKESNSKEMKKYNSKSQYQKSYFEEMKNRKANKDFGIKESVPSTDKNTVIRLEGFDQKLKKIKKFSQIKYSQDNIKVRYNF
jgi:hypothetical protein